MRVVDPVSVGGMAKIAGGGREVSPEKKLEKACRDFESFFVAEMLKKNVASSQGPDREKKSFASLEETSMEMVAESLSAHGQGMGLWRVLYNDLCRALPGGDGAAKTREIEGEES